MPAVTEPLPCKELFSNCQQARAHVPDQHQPQLLRWPGACSPSPAHPLLFHRAADTTWIRHRMWPQLIPWEPGSIWIITRWYLHPAEENPPAMKQQDFTSDLAQPVAPIPEFSTLLHLSNPESQIKCQTTAFPPWNDSGRRERGSWSEMQANHFYTTKSMLPAGQKTGCKNMLTSDVFSLEALAAPMKYR